MKSLREIVPSLDEAKKSVYKRRGSLKAQVKSQGDIAKEKTERRKAMRGAKRETKETGEKVKFQKFKDWRSVRKSAREKIREDLQELSLQRLGSFVDKAEAKDYEEDSTKHRKGINLALRKRGEHRHSADVPPKVRATIKEAKGEYSKTKTAGGEGAREHFYVDAGRRASHVRSLKDMGLDARHEYSPYSNLAGLSVPKQHAKKVSEYLWPKSRKKR